MGSVQLRLLERYLDVHTLRRAYRWWHVRRAVVLSAATLGVIGLAAAQALRLHESPAVFAVSILVTAQIACILGFLLARHMRRQAPRESAFAAVLGVAAAVVLTVAAPLLAPRLQAAQDTPIMVRAAFDEPGRPIPALASSAAERVPVEPAAVVAPQEPPPVEIERTRPAPTPVVQETEDKGSSERPEFNVYRKLQEDPLRLQREPERRTHQELSRPGLPSDSDPLALPPMQIAASLFLSHIDGKAGMPGLNAPLDELLGERTFENAFELTAQFPLSPRQVLRVSMIGLRSSEEGELESDLDFGGLFVPAGSNYTFDFQWAHLFVGFSHRLAGYTRESAFDLAVHVGAMLDHLVAEIETSAGGVQADERGWGAPAVGVTVGVWSFGQSGLLVEVMQSIPINIGGQTLAVTDLRVVVQQDLTSAISFVIGYRWLLASFKTFDHPVTYAGSRRESVIEAGGPVLGLDIRF